MAAALKKPEQTTELNSEPEVTAGAVTDLIPTTISRTSPFRSPARDLQQSLAERLQEPAPARSEVATGLIVGILGASWITALLMYVTF